MIQQTIEAQLLPEASDTRDIYVEFNIADKLKGSFEEQAQSLQLLVGRPMMTANEGRARPNLPRQEDASADELAAQQGGPSGTSGQQPPTPPTDPTADGATAANVALVLDATARRQRARLSGTAAADRPAAFTASRERWMKELVADLAPFVTTDEALRVAANHNDRTLAGLNLEAMNDW
jgi:hypothetical protein